MVKTRRLFDYLKRESLTRQYETMLRSIVYGLPQIEGVPTTICTWELMKNLCRYGYSFIGETTRASVSNGIKVLDNAVAGGVTEYDDVPEFCTYANPINDSKTYYIGKDCAMIRMTATYLRFDSVIRRYAVMLADADITTDMSIISLRAKNVLTGCADDSTQKNSIEKFFERLTDGFVSHIMSRTMMSNIQTLPLGGDKDDAIASTIIKNNILRQFYKELGINMSKDKSQAVLSDEVESDSQSLRVNANTFLSALKKGIEDCNALFGWDASVKLNPVYDIDYYTNIEATDSDLDDVEDNIQEDEDNLCDVKDNEEVENEEPVEDAEVIEEVAEELIEEVKELIEDESIGTVRTEE